MGWGSFFAGLAADAAKEYVNKRGLDGVIEDAGNIKNKVTGMFSGNDDDYSEDYSQDNSEDFWGTLDSYIEEKDFHGAEVYVNNYVGQGAKDDFYFYAMAYVYNLKAVYFDSIEDERKAKSYISNAVNMLNGDADWRKSVYDLRKQIDDNLNIFRKEKEEAKQAEKEWERIMDLFDLNSGCSGDKAVTALEEYYNKTNQERDIYYHILVFRGYEKLILEDNDPLDIFYDEMKTKVAIVMDLARSNPEEYGELANSMRERLIFLQENYSAQHTTPSTTNSVSEEEAEYLEELKVCYEDGIITDKERRLLDRLRKSLGISEARASELEAMCQPQSLTAEEQEYADEVKACLEDDGEITAKERRLLDRLAKSLGITPNRATEIEQMIK
ncbi:MAG: tellurite resistance TerB family protein [Muribaculaceae bacterium]|nr:tellurite resistance TerB family protein [Muribaculaceae bacterium]